VPIAKTANPMINGPRLEVGLRLRPSVMAKTQISSSAVPTASSTNGPPTEPWKYEAGNVAKIENVVSAFPALGTRWNAVLAAAIAEL